MIRVLVNGAKGKMGQVIVAEIAHESDLKLVAQTDRDDDLASTMIASKPDVVIDFTAPKHIYETVQSIIAHNVHPVIGTTGLSLEQIKKLQIESRNKSLGGIIAPNFSLGAVLMMKYAKDAIKYFSEAEIIELHHSQKIDAPSGTAIKTAELMAESRTTKGPSKKSAMPARGESYHDIPIHSVRLPGLVSHQTVIFGGYEETLTIRHDSLNRKSFTPGIFMACRKVLQLNELIYGLENLI